MMKPLKGFQINRLCDTCQIDAVLVCHLLERQRKYIVSAESFKGQKEEKKKTSCGCF